VKLDRRSVLGASVGICGLLLVPCGPAHGRDTRVIGDVSVGYEYTERTYAAPEEQVEGEPVVDSRDDGNEGDTRKFFIAPRVTVLSSGVTDLIQFTYSPRFTHDNISDSNEVEHDLGLRYENSLTKRWKVQVSDNLYVGDDSVRESVTRTADIDPEAEETGSETIGADTDQGIVNGNLTERVGRHRFWRNNLGFETDYAFGEDSLVGAGIHYEKLDNIDEIESGYTPYDRYFGLLRFAYRFNRRWTTDLEFNYTKGDFEESTVYVVSQAAAGLTDTTAGDQTVQDQDVAATTGKEEGGAADAADAASPTDTQESALPVDVDVRAEDVSEDLQEYRFMGGLHYLWSARDRLSLFYEYLATDYDHPLREDTQVHQLALNWGHDFSAHLHMTLSGGPTFEKQDSSSWSGDYNAHAGLTWDFYRGMFRIYADKRYTQENFNGRQDGLTDSWTAGVELSYTVVKDLAATLFATYEDKQRYQRPVTNTPTVITEEQLDELAQMQEEGEQTSYHEKNSSIGTRLSYTFGRWYTVSAVYRFTNHDIDLAGDEYDEHRFYIQFTVSRNLFRW